MCLLLRTCPIPSDGTVHHYYRYVGIVRTLTIYRLFIFLFALPLQIVDFASVTVLLNVMTRMPLCTLAKALATGKTTSEFNVLDMNEIRVDT